MKLQVNNPVVKTGLRAINIDNVNFEVMDSVAMNKGIYATHIVEKWNIVAPTITKVIRDHYVAVDQTFFHFQLFLPLWDVMILVSLYELIYKMQ